MSKIKLLPIEQAKKIAAGEVIERPANAFKELVENSIDANAKNITIYLEDAGKKLIHIIDDGCGMSEEDAKLCIEHHATSKISTIDDLQTIQTFGFRGEALSAISSVSLVNLITKEAIPTQANCETGISLEIENGNIVKQLNTSCNTGTNIAIKDLFWNIPARKKFLKTKETELRSIIQIFFAFCLNYPNIHFKLFHNQKLLYNCPSVLNLENKLRQIYDTYLVENILLFDVIDEKNSLKVHGAISNPNYSRFDRNQIFLFVNNRWIKNYKLVSSVIKGYQNILQERKYPAAFIFISIDPKEIDINIHPRKEEVQFLHPKIVENLIENTIKQRLEEYLNSGLGKKLVQKWPNYTKEAGSELQDKFLNSELEKARSITFQEINQSNIEANSFQKNLIDSAISGHASNGTVKEINSEQDFLSILNNAGLERRQISEPVFAAMQLRLAAPQNGVKLDQTQNQIQSQLESQDSLIKNPHETIEYQLIGQSFLTYIILQTESGITIIDQHAAHERVIYERIKHQFNKIETVKLIFPQIVNLSEDDISVISQYLELFALFGVSIEQIGKNQIIILQTPVFLKNQSLDDVIKQAISIVSDNKFLSKDNLKNLLIEKIHAQLSCKSSIKAGQELSIETMNQLIKELYLTANRMTCPHGRPTTWILTKTEIEKKFKRDYR